MGTLSKPTIQQTLGQLGPLLGRTRRIWGPNELIKNKSYVTVLILKTVNFPVAKILRIIKIILPN